jgi:hypothetical protein
LYLGIPDCILTDPGAGGNCLVGAYDDNSGSFSASVSVSGFVSTPKQTSSVWSGYVATQASAYTTAAASLIIPAVTCPAEASSSVVMWTGIGGNNGQETLVQNGVTDTCDEGVNEGWEAFYESNPQKSATKLKRLPVQPGDLLAVRTVVTGNSVTYTFHDTTEDWLKTLPPMTIPTSTPTTSAECIVEAPREGSGAITPLSDFGSMEFQTCSFVAGGVNCKILSRCTDGSVTTSQTLVKGNSVLAAPESPLGDGNAFAVNWERP